MGARPRSPELLLQLVEAQERLQSHRKVAEEFDMHHSNVGRALAQAHAMGLDNKPVYAGSKRGRVTYEKPLPPKGKVFRYLLTCAQNNTHVHREFWENLLAFAEYFGAEIMVSRFTYNKASYAAKSVKPGKGPTAEDQADVWYEKDLEPYFNDERVLLAPGLYWCGEANTLPTAVRPLSGFETYTGRASAIFPHTKLQVQSIASMKHEATKFNYTTGAVTQLNYIQKKAGLKAEHHHCFGASLVEVNSDGNWWVRQINAEEDGTFFDLDVRVHDRAITMDWPVEAVNWGDVHVERLDPTVAELCWGEGGVIDRYKPRHQFMHDTLDFRSRNHHERKDPIRLFEKWGRGVERVEDELRRCARFLNVTSYRDFCKTVVVDSNHDRALERWVKETDYRWDPANALCYLRAALAIYEAVERKDEGFHLVEHMLRELGVRREVKFLGEDESYVVCREHNGGIECGMHGHLGPDGSRGNPLGLSKMGRRANTGHTHSAGIWDGLYVAGTSSKLDMGYNRGPSSWSQTLIFTYANGKRTLVTIWNGKERA